MALFIYLCEGTAWCPSVMKVVPFLSASHSNSPSFKDIYFSCYYKKYFTFFGKVSLISVSVCCHMFLRRVPQLPKCNKHEGDQPWLLPGVRYLFRPRAERPRLLEEYKAAREKE